ncbi:hypothetical protein Ddc_06829 [Ditylenchus destructor]|nr:hypothetical protein Ddc_06829 [Ditylenchus destructor]
MSVVLSPIAMDADSHFLPASLSPQPQLSTQSAVIRARYEPDVRGINRYKHFHRPLLTQEGPSGEAVNGGNIGIDIKSTSKSPRPKSPRFRHDLPLIENNAAGKNFISAKLPVEKTSQSDNCPPVSTWRIRKKKLPASDDEDHPNNTSHNAPESSAFNENAGLTVSKPSQMPLSPLHSSALPYIGAVGNGQVSRGLLTVAPSFLNRSPSPTTNISDEVSMITAQQIRKPEAIKKLHNSEKLKLVMPVGNIRPETTVNKKKNDESQTSNFSNVSDDSKKAFGAISLRVGEKIALLNGQFEKAKRQHRGSDNATRNSAKTSKKKETAEFGTQTELSSQGASRSPLSHESSTSTDISFTAATTERTPKATQTEQLRFFHKVNSISGDNVVELEQRSELLEIIDSALDETIDRHSRMLTNQNIISAARKQAQVWRDAKDFVSSMLVPCSIELANKTRSSRMPFEKIASIQLP